MDDLDTTASYESSGSNLHYAQRAGTALQLVTRRLAVTEGLPLIRGRGHSVSSLLSPVG